MIESRWKCSCALGDTGEHEFQKSPPTEVMTTAFFEKDSQFDGVFFTAVRTTGIFCRPSCPARKPLLENIEFFPAARDALFAGYRPCKRCRPLALPGEPPDWVNGLMERVEEDPNRRWKDQDLRDLGVDPLRARRWFQARYGMTFQAYQRSRRLGLAFACLRDGQDLTDTAYDSGFESLSGFRDAFTRLFRVPPGRARGKTQVIVRHLYTPLGPMVAGAVEDALVLLEFSDRRMLETQVRRLQGLLDCSMTPGSNSVLNEAELQLKAYFEGSLRDFTVPLLTPGSTFQKQVWDGLRQIPYGETSSYLRQATLLGRPDCVRAVARANGDNRIAILIPCHRVIASDGSLCGYGGGIWRKRHLLALEAGCFKPPIHPGQ
jgi:AraC family transcriptional regulator, regulatory protein of adaptative response / methylated-DNA-[protein]-cysteine methyltransferase